MNCEVTESEPNNKYCGRVRKSHYAMDRQLGCKRKYKSYTYHGMNTSIPDRTQRRWAATKKLKGTTAVAEHNEQDDDFRMRESPGPDVDDDNPQSVENLSTGDVEQGPALMDDDVFGFLSEVESEDENSPTRDTETAVNESPNILQSSLSGYPTEQLIPTLMALAFKLRHNLSYAATEDALLLAKILTDARVMYASKYYWKKISNSLCHFLSIHHFCSGCNSYIGKEVGNPEDNETILRCPRCDCLADLTTNWKSGNVVLTLNLKDQIEYLLELNHEKLINPTDREKTNKYAFEDIFDGKMYKKSVSENSISLNFNVDGTPIFKSSPTSIYPVLCTINEIAPEERGKHMILSSLWFGEGKPKNMNEFLRPFVIELQDLTASGLEYTHQGKVYHKSFRVIVGICDSIARPVVRNSSQFNGEYGCGLCLHPGVQVPKGHGSVRVYPIDDDENPFGEGLRNHDETLIHAMNQENGMKSRSVMYDAPGFDVINGLVADWMHLATLGIAKQFCKIWFDSDYRCDKPFYLGKHESLINSMLQSFTPTLEISRTTREITQRAYWKAHEWSIWLLFYSLPILKETLPKKYVDHWALLVDGLSILLKISIMPSQVEYARQCLYDFVKGVKELYGIEHVSFNVHLLTHLPDSVLNWGPLWTHSAFMYESFNFILKKSVHSANGVPLQITDSFRYQVAIMKLRSICEASLSYSQKQFVSGMLHKRIRPRVSLSINNVGVLGGVQPVETLSRPFYLALRRLNIHPENASIALAIRMCINNEVIHSKQYKRPQKRKSYIVLSRDGEVFEIEEFVILSYVSHQECYAIGYYYVKTNSLFLGHRRLTHFTFVNNKESDLAAINVNQIQEKVTLLHLSKLDVSIACTHPNKYESWK